jgi:hypothetical protein
MGNGTDTATLAGVVLGNLFLESGAGNDDVTLGGFVAQRATVILGGGSNTFTFTGVVGLPGTTGGVLYVTAWPGNNVVNLAGTAAVNGYFRADLLSGEAFISVGAGFRTDWGLIDGYSSTQGLHGVFFPPVVLQSVSFFFLAL